MRRDHTLLLLTRLKSRAASSRDHFQCMWLLRTYPRVILDLVHFKKRLLSFVHVSIIFIKAICRAIRHVALAVYCISQFTDFHFRQSGFLISGVPVLVPVRASPVPSVVRGSFVVKF